MSTCQWFESVVDAAKLVEHIKRQGQTPRQFEGNGGWWVAWL